MTIPSEFVCLDREMLCYLANEPRVDNRPAFRAFLKGRYRTQLERIWWGPLSTGEEVPRELAELFIRFSQEKTGWPEGPIAKHLIPMPPPLDPQTEKVTSNWHRIYDLISDHRQDRFLADEGMFATPGDIPQAAEMIQYCAGFLLTRPGEPFDRVSCIARGQAFMPWNPTAYVDWLQVLHTQQPYSVMFALVGNLRIASCVTIGVTEDFADRYCAGKVSDFELTPQGMQSPSSSVLVDACGIAHDLLPSLDPLASAVAQIFCIQYQVAYHTRGFDQPRAITLSTNRQFDRRLERDGLRSVGVCMKGTPFPVMAMDHLCEARSYRDYRYLLQAYQEANDRCWRNSPMSV